MLFAALVFDRMPLQWSQLPIALAIWVQNAGAVAAFAIALVLLARLLQREANDSRFWNLSAPAVLTILKYCIILSGVGYILLILMWMGNWMGIGILRTLQAQITMVWIFTLSGAIALGVALTPL